MRRTGLTAAIAAAALALAFVVLRGGAAYTVQMKLANAGGLRDGSPVVVGGVEVGTVRLDAHFDSVDVKLDIERRYAPIGKDATAAIIAQNVLGQKQVRLNVGDAAKEPAPENYVIPARQTSASTDLDQLLSTLDADTRTRLAIIINETGTAFAGRRIDFQTFVHDLAPALASGRDLLGQLTQSNQVLGNLLRNSDSFVASLAGSREQISHAIDVLGATTETVAARRAALREALRRAPAALASARGFLGELRQTTAPLASTARLLRHAAPSLSTTLDRLGPFTAAAKPALQAATVHAAPALQSLGDVSTPKVRSILPTVVDARKLVQDDVPAVGTTLDQSVDNLTAVLENWARAIQFRDGIGHVFRGEATFAPGLYERLIANLGGNVRAQRKEQRKHTRTPLAASPQATPVPSHAPAVNPIQATKDKLTNTINDLVSKPLLPGTQPVLPPETAKQTKRLLDFLLRP